jgi:isoleucyl-tRNA synthetase
MAMKIIPASHVTADSGTGLVHCAPAHGAEDYMAFRSLGLISNLENMICHVNADGNFTKDVASVVGQKAAMLLLGQQVLGEGGRAIVEMLKKMDCLVKVKRIKHRYPYDWRTDKPIIVT